MKLHRYVADVQPLYAACNLVVVPTVVSAGTNLKVLEAMASGRAVLATTCGSEGLSLIDRESVWIADDAANFADGVLRLLNEHETRASIAARARQIAEGQFGWQRLGLKQRELWRELLGMVFIREAAKADLIEIARIQAKAPDASQWEPDLYLGFATIVAVFRGEIAGFLVSRRTATNQHEILNVVVEQCYRRRGIATRLLRHVLDAGCEDAFLEVRESNSAAISLYDMLGFQEVSRRPEYYDNPREGAIVMRYQAC